jgi:hypothetical protein
MASRSLLLYPPFAKDGFPRSGRNLWQILDACFEGLGRHTARMGGRTIILLGALAAAGLTAALLGTLAHGTLGIPRSEIRADALGSAALLAIVWGASYFREPRQ